ncbi:hypothetical protein [Polyangium sp. 15x6]|uniref:hypothetical protein n=1 Tax=Polyangium sp. 15x6 TaxID=3042687 RepID=UPI00249A7842|nr:hypothetical protein [Polyangium sp. 15x6]MDI3286269.1 hypothetical protein [Polyangium sp. 15x6]
MQAVTGAIWLVPVFLRTITNDTGGRLEFEGSADLGFYMEPHEAFKPPAAVEARRLDHPVRLRRRGQGP